MGISFMYFNEYMCTPFMVRIVSPVPVHVCLTETYEDGMHLYIFSTDYVTTYFSVY